MTRPDGQYQFNPPPNWPAPPKGWVAEAGWRPDANWPPAPDGWVVWLPAETSASLTAPPLEQHRHRKTFAEIRKEQANKQAEKKAAKTAEKLAQAASKEVARAGSEAAARRQELLAQRASLEEQIDFVQGWPENAPRAGGLVLKKGEHPVGVVTAAGLVEVKRAQGHFVAGSAGVSVRVAKGMRVRAGQTRGHMVPGAETETQIDSGSAVITNTRIVFSGSRQTREWKFDNLVGRNLVGNRQMSWLELPVSNRQKMSALSFPKAEAVTSAVELALLFHGGEQARLVEELRRQLAELAD